MKTQSYIVIFLLIFLSINIYSQTKIDTLLRFYDFNNKIYLEKSLHKEDSTFYYIDENGKSVAVDTFIYYAEVNSFVKEYINKSRINYSLSHNVCDTLCHFYCVLIEDENIVKEARIIDKISYYQNSLFTCNNIDFLSSTKHDFTFNKFRESFNKAVRIKNKKYPILVFHVSSCNGY